MGENEYVSPEICRLERKTIETEIEALKKCDGDLEERMKDIKADIKDVLALQKTLLYAIIFVSIGVALTLFGVLMGRGIDFGWLRP